MHIYDAYETAERLPFPALINQLERLFADGHHAPDRHHHTMPMPQISEAKSGLHSSEPDATLLLMPVWSEDIGCVKVVTVTPGNSARNLPAIAGSVLVFDRATGAHIALLDGATLTARRTAAASALAARHLSREDSKTLLIIGSGKVAAQLPDAFGAVRPIEKVMVWNIFPEGAEQLAAQLREAGWDASAVSDLGKSVAQADIISAATLATEPLLKGQWLKEGQHIDLIGAFTPSMREVDDQALQRSSIFVDTDFATKEAGELKTPLEKGVISLSDIKGDLYSITSGLSSRTSAQEITLFKSVGNAVMDLAASITSIKDT